MIPHRVAEENHKLKGGARGGESGELDITTDGVSLDRMWANVLD
jgi:hypothetical protein